ncbi:MULTISPECIES: hypothetical protein [Methylotenera]|uniref:hypothetical protein n=1 Tax=Methylotenera TaxID=359407 RepID=UPI00037E07E9|nr:MULTISPECIES: hypothetical protein [Methylotenera]
MAEITNLNSDLTDLNAVKTAQKANILSLFTSGSTLICCALPATLVAIGSAATLTSLITHFPQLIWISEHKPLVFGLAGAMLAIAGYLQWQARNVPCPADANLAAVCAKTRRNALRVYWLSVVIFAIGAFFAFVAPLVV